MSESIEEFLDGYESPRQTARITMRADLLAAHNQLQHDHARAVREDMSANEPDTAPRIKRELADLEEEIAATESPFVFEALGSHAYKKLKAQPEHRPRKEDRKEQLDFNPETFPQSLIAACCVAPAMTDEQAERLCERLSDGQFAKLWNAAIAVNVGDDQAPKSVLRFATAEQNENSSTTAPPEESPSVSSLDE